MKRLRISQWGFQLIPPSARLRPATCPFYDSSHRLQAHRIRLQSTSASIEIAPAETQPHTSPEWDQSIPLEKLPSPPPSHALKSAKLSALHARLSLPSRFPVQTLARTLVDKTADPSPDFNNANLAILGSQILAFYCSEHIISHYPRLPGPILMEAQYSYVGPESLSQISHEWGVENAAEPGGEVDPGLLQLQFQPPDTDAVKSQETESTKQSRDTVSSQILKGDEFGGSPKPKSIRPGTTILQARNSFVRAVFGAMYLHCGRIATHRFFKSHILSRHVDIAKLFHFREATRDLSRLCAREGIHPPVARLISETGRLSRHAVYVVGIYSGAEKLGEAAGASLREARARAAVAALKSWYMYSPEDVTVPSSVERGEGPWRPNHVDCGEIVT